MSLPLRWASGDRCVVAGRAGYVVKVYPGFAKVRFYDRPYAAEILALRDLELVPFAMPEGML